MAAGRIEKGVGGESVYRAGSRTWRLRVIPFGLSAEGCVGCIYVDVYEYMERRKMEYLKD